MIFGIDFGKLVKALPIVKIISCIAAVLITALLWLVIKKMFRRYAEKTSNGRMLTLLRVLVSVARSVLFVICVLVILQICGVNVTGAVAGLGIVGAIVGLALQDILKDFIMGVHIMSDDFFKIGDCVVYDGEEAKVVELTMKTTKLELLCDKSVISVCNRNIEEIKKLSTVMEFTVPMPYTVAHTTVSQTLKNIGEKIGDLSNVEKCEYHGAYDFGESSISHKFWIYCVPEERYSVKLSAMNATLLELEKVGIDIPFNQLDVHIDNNCGGKNEKQKDG